MRSYEAARSLFSFLAFASWVMIILGAIAAFGGFAAASQMGSFGRGANIFTSLIGALPGIGIALGGFFSLAMVQNGRASVDSAEYAQQGLKLARDQLELSKQALRQGDALQQSYATLAAKSEPDSIAASFSNLPVGTSEASPPEPETVALAATPERQLVDYQGHQLVIADGMVQLGRMSFDTLDAAQRYVDRIGVPRGGAALRAGQETPAGPHPEEIVIHRGATIEPKAGKFVYNGIPFDTLTAAKRYIETFVGDPTKTTAGS